MKMEMLIEMEIWIKGVLTAEDVLKAVEMGAERIGERHAAPFLSSSPTVLAPTWRGAMTREWIPAATISSSSGKRLSVMSWRYTVRPSSTRPTTVPWTGCALPTG